MDVLDIVKNSKKIADQSGLPPVELQDIDYISCSYLSTLHRALAGNGYFFGNAHYLEFGRELHKRYLEPHLPITRMSDVDEINLSRMLEILYADSEMQTFYERSVREQCIVAPIYGQEVKVKLDMEKTLWGKRKIKDIKTTSARTYQEFMASTFKFKYWKQAAIYMAVGEADEFEFVAPSKKNDMLFKLNVTDYPQYLKLGRMQARHLIEIHKSLKNYVHLNTAYLGIA